MRLGDARETLETAYTINKMTIDNDMWEKPTHKIAITRAKPVKYDSHIKSERREIVSTPGPITRGEETWVGRTSTNYRVMNFLEAGKVIAAAERISQGHTDWARFCYDPLQCCVQSRVVEVGGKKMLALNWANKSYLPLARRLFAAWAWGNKRVVDLKRGPLFMKLAIMCLADTRHRFITKSPLHGPGSISIYLGYNSADHANWYRDIKQHYELMYKILERMDSAIMREVATEIDTMREFD